MKTAALFCLSMLILLSPASYGDGDSEQVTIWHQFYFEKGLDYNQYAEVGTTRSEFRRLFVEEIAAMQERGASPIEAAVVLLTLDDHYIKTLNYSAQGLENSFAAEFRSALVAQYERAYKPQRIVITDGAYYKRTPLNLGDPQPPEGVDLIASGTWSNIDGNTVRVTVDFTSMDSGRITSFTSQGTIPEVANSIAYQLFDYIEKHRYPQPINPFANLLVHPALPGHQGRMGVPREVAVRVCEAQGYRLPYACEMDLIYAQGPYENGGVEVQPERYYHIADDADHVWLAPGKIEHVRGTSLANFEKRQPLYIMVKGTPSPRAQTIIALNAALRTEYRRPERERDSLNVYAIRLVLNDLGFNRGENGIALQTMNDVFISRKTTPAEYLASRGFTLNYHN